MTGINRATAITSSCTTSSKPGCWSVQKYSSSTTFFISRYKFSKFKNSQKENTKLSKIYHSTLITPYFQSSQTCNFIAQLYILLTVRKLNPNIDSTRKSGSCYLIKTCCVRNGVLTLTSLSAAFTNLQIETDRLASDIK